MVVADGEEKENQLSKKGGDIMAAISGKGNSYNEDLEARESNGRFTELPSSLQVDSQGDFAKTDGEQQSLLERLWKPPQTEWTSFYEMQGGSRIYEERERHVQNHALETLL